MALVTTLWYGGWRALGCRVRDGDRTEHRRDENDREDPCPETHPGILRADLGGVDDLDLDQHPVVHAEPLTDLAHDVPGIARVDVQRVERSRAARSRRTSARLRSC